MSAELVLWVFGCWLALACVLGVVVGKCIAARNKVEE